MVPKVVSSFCALTEEEKGKKVLFQTTPISWYPVTLRSTCNMYNEYYTCTVYWGIMNIMYMYSEAIILIMNIIKVYELQTKIIVESAFC